MSFKRFELETHSECFGRGANPRPAIPPSFLLAYKAFVDLYVFMFAPFSENDPHPYKSFETAKSYFMIQSEHDKNADAIKKLPLETIIKRSLTTPIQAQ